MIVMPMTIAVAEVRAGETISQHRGDDPRTASAWRSPFSVRNRAGRLDSISAAYRTSASFISSEG